MASDLYMTLLSYSNIPKGAFEEKKPVMCFLGAVSHIWAIRNAYWSTWSESSPFMPFRPTRSEAEREIEANRRQGSHWYIDVLPALVVSSAGAALVVVQPNVLHPLSDYPLLTEYPESLAQVAEHFSPRGGNSIARLAGKREVIAPAELPCKRYESKVSGPKELPLEWVSRSEAFDITSVLEHVQCISQLLQRT